MIYSNSLESKIGRLERNEKQISRYDEKDEVGYFEWVNFRKHGGFKHESPSMYFPIFIKKDSLRIPNMEWDDNTNEWILKEKPKSDESVIYPIDENGKDRRWKWGIERTKNEISNMAVRLDRNKELGVYIKSYINEEGILPLTWWDKKEYSATSYGTNLLRDLFTNPNVFSYPKSLYAVQDCIKVLNTSQNEYILDYFSGSGTTGHAIITLNKLDKLNRKYLLIEMGVYFDNVTKQRIQKVIFTENWRDGKPVDNKGTNKHIFKYLVLEQYEDILDAIEQFEGETPKNLPLKYLYKPELNKINSTLDLSKPFSNKIKYGQPTKEGFVDLVDTYNYLQGGEVKSIKTYTINKKFYKVVEAADTIVVWRDIALGEDDSKAVKEIADKYPDATQIEVNYDFNILATLKDKQLQVGKRVLGVNIIHVDVFNQ